MKIGDSTRVHLRRCGYSVDEITVYFDGEPLGDADNEDDAWDSAFQHYLGRIREAMETMTPQDWNTALTDVTSHIIATPASDQGAP